MKKIYEEKNWLTHSEFVVIFITLIGGFYLLDGKIERQSGRTDRLYEMFIDTQTEIKQLHGRVCVNEIRQEFTGR